MTEPTQRGHKAAFPEARREKFMTNYLRREGDCVHHDPDDPGGETAYGVAQKYNPELWDGETPPSRETALAHVWTKYAACGTDEGIDRYPLPLQELMFDMRVNPGIGTAEQILQQALNRLTPLGANLKVDGIAGIKTMAAVSETMNRCSARALVNMICDFRWQYYLKKIKANPVKEKYRKIWLKRTNEFRV